MFAGQDGGDGGATVKRVPVRRMATAIGVAAAIGLAGPAAAQTSAGQGVPAARGQASGPVSGQAQMGEGAKTWSPAPQTPKAHFSNGTIEAAGKAMRDIRRIDRKYTPEMQAAARAKDKAKMSEINRRAQHEAIRRLSSDGISPRKYERVMRVAQNDPALRQRLLQAAGFVQHK